MKFQELIKNYLKKIKKYLSAFNQSETSILLITLCILGIIIVPPMIRQQSENANRTKLKKIFITYDNFIQELVLENEIRSYETFRSYADEIKENNCSSMSEYFEIKEQENCAFKTIDGVWWDLSDIEYPMVAFRKKYLDEQTALSKKNYAFIGVVTFDVKSGSFQLNNPHYINDADNDSKLKIKKINRFIYSKSN